MITYLVISCVVWVLFYGEKMPSHYGKHGTRREYLRHNPTDWRERAMGAVRRKKKKNK